MHKLLLLFLLVLKIDANVNGLDLSHENTLQKSKVTDSGVTQGSLKLYDSVLSNTMVNSQNRISNTDISDNSLVQQSVVELVNGSALEESEIQLSSFIDKSDIGLNSYVVQNGIYMNNALVNSSLIESYSRLKNTEVKESVVSQSQILLGSGSKVENDSSFHLNNSVDDVSMNTSHFYQGGIVMHDSTLNNVEMNSNHLLTSNSGGVILENATLIQGQNMMERSTVNNSRLESESVISDTMITDATLNMCSTYMYEVTVSNTNINKHCSMEKSKITNGATVYQAMTRFN